MADEERFKQTRKNTLFGGRETEGPSKDAFGGLRGSRVGRRASRVPGGLPLLKFVSRRPGVAGLLGAGLSFAPMIGKAGAETFFDLGTGSELERGKTLDRAIRMRGQQQARIQQLMARNALRLAQTDPHLANEILAGRRLPQDAVVLGGRPRTDLLEEVAMDMAMGRFGPPPVDPVGVQGNPMAGLEGLV